jgi:hypothetical protein
MDFPLTATLSLSTRVILRVLDYLEGSKERQNRAIALFGVLRASERMATFLVRSCLSRAKRSSEGILRAQIS